MVDSNLHETHFSFAFVTAIQGLHKKRHNLDCMIRTIYTTENVNCIE